MPWAAPWGAHAAGHGRVGSGVLVQAELMGIKKSPGQMTECELQSFPGLFSGS